MTVVLQMCSAHILGCLIKAGTIINGLGLLTVYKENTFHLMAI